MTPIAQSTRKPVAAPPSRIAGPSIEDFMLSFVAQRINRATYAFRSLIREFRETDFNDRIVRHVVVPEGENVGNCCSCFGVKATSPCHARAAPLHRAIGRLPKPRNPPKSITTMISLFRSRTMRRTRPRTSWLLDRTEYLLPEKIADPNGLRESHSSRLRQAHARRWRHTSRCPALRVRRAGDGEHPAHEQAAGRCHHAQIPANHGKPNDSRYPPGYLLVTSMAVTHFGFL